MKQYDDVYDYGDEYSEGLTFKKIGRFFKAGWIRMIAYALVCVAITTVIALPIKFFYKTESVAQTTIEYVYEGIEEGLDPNGGTLTTNNIISTSVIAKAVEQAELTSKLTDISKLRSKMRVEGVETEEYLRLVEDAANGDTAAQEQLRGYVMFPTQFNIILSEPKKEFGLKDDEAQRFLNEIVNVYYDDFKTRYSVTQMFTNVYNLSENSAIEFVDAYDTYMNRLTAMNEFIALMPTEMAEFISGKYDASFKTLSSDVAALKSLFNSFYANLLNDNVWRNSEIAKGVLSEDKALTEKRQSILSDNITALKDQIEKIKPTSSVTTTNSDGTIVVTEIFPEIYYTLNEQLSVSNAQLGEYALQLYNITARLNKIDTNPTAATEKVTQAEANLKLLEAQAIATTTKLNNVLADYYDVTFISSSVRNIKSPVVMRRAAKVDLFIIYVSVIIGAVLIAGFVTGYKISKSNMRAKENASDGTVSNDDSGEKAEQKQTESVNKQTTK